MGFLKTLFNYFTLFHFVNCLKHSFWSNAVLKKTSKEINHPLWAYFNECASGPRLGLAPERTKGGRITECKAEDSPPTPAENGAASVRGMETAESEKPFHSLEEIHFRAQAALPCSRKQRYRM